MDSSSLEEDDLDRSGLGERADETVALGRVRVVGRRSAVRSSRSIVRRRGRSSGSSRGRRRRSTRALGRRGSSRSVVRRRRSSLSLLGLALLLVVEVLLPSVPSLSLSALLHPRLLVRSEPVQLSLCVLIVVVLAVVEEVSGSVGLVLFLSIGASGLVVVRRGRRQSSNKTLDEPTRSKVNLLLNRHLCLLRRGVFDRTDARGLDKFSLEARDDERLDVADRSLGVRDERRLVGRQGRVGVAERDCSDVGVGKDSDDMRRGAVGVGRSVGRRPMRRRTVARRRSRGRRSIVRRGSRRRGRSVVGRRSLKVCGKGTSVSTGYLKKRPGHETYPGRRPPG